MDIKQTRFLQLIEENKGILFKISKIYQDDPKRSISHKTQ